MSSDKTAGSGVTLKEVLRTSASLVILPWGLIQHAVTGKTGGKAYQSLIWLSCVTGNRTNAALSWLIARLRPARTLPAATGILGDMSGANAAQHVERLRRDGCIVFERALSPERCDRLLQFARSTPAKMAIMDGETAAKENRDAVFNGEQPVAVRYDYDTADLLDNADVQDLLADPSLLRLAQEYLQCQPVADVLSMWWHTNYHKQPDSGAAQFYHFDMDRIKWFKVFIYLTDVGPDNGPHSFVVGSHRTGGIPWKLRRKGYVRLMDDEVLEEYGTDRCIDVTAPRGSVIVEDTCGLHKGNAVRGDPRLILQLQFSNSLFGGNIPRVRVTRIQSPAFRAQLAAVPEVYRQYV